MAAIHTLPNVDEGYRIAVALGTTVEHLISPNAPARNEHELLEAYRRLNEAGKQAALGAVRGLYSGFPTQAGDKAAKTAG